MRFVCFPFMKKYLSLVAFSHTIFALPFALIGLSLGLEVNQPTDFLLKIFFVILCMIFARSAAMAFNRFLDRHIDAKNARTATREIPAGLVSERAAIMLVIISSALFVFCSYLLNYQCFILSPIALLVVLGYSYTKRFTWLCHFILGLGLALAPIGAYLATGGNFDIIPVLYSFVVLFWVGGFDIIYSLQDEEFDKKQALHSVPTWLGGKKALNLSKGIHLIAAIILIFVTFQIEFEFNELGILHWVGTIVFLFFLYYQHTVVNLNNLSNINKSFFTINGFASVLYGTCFLIDFWN